MPLQSLSDHFVNKSLPRSRFCDSLTIGFPENGTAVGASTKNRGHRLLADQGIHATLERNAIAGRFAESCVASFRCLVATYTNDVQRRRNAERRRADRRLVSAPIMRGDYRHSRPG